MRVAQGDMNMKSPFQLVDENFQVLQNSAGYQQVITTLTSVSKKLSEQRFYEIPWADFMPTVIGNGAFNRQILNWRSFVKAGGFEQKIVSNASNKARLEQVDASFDAVTQNIYTYAAAVDYSVIELQEAMQANNLFSLVEAREIARRKEWSLGLQKFAFLGGVGGEKGFLNLSTVTNDTGTLTKRLYAMTADELNTFAGVVYEKYRNNANRTCKPTHFTIPEADFNGLTTFIDPNFAIKTKLAFLTEVFQTLTGNKNFKIQSCAYCDLANFDGTNNRYVLSNYDETSGKFDIPLDYTMTQAGTFNGFNFENAAYGQFAPYIAIRPLEMYYFSNTAA
jgi:hypothetical protein